MAELCFKSRQCDSSTRVLQREMTNNPFMTFPNVSRKVQGLRCGINKRRQEDWCWSESEPGVPHSPSDSDISLRLSRRQCLHLSHDRWSQLLMTEMSWALQSDSLIFISPRLAVCARAGDLIILNAFCIPSGGGIEILIIIKNCWGQMNGFYGEQSSGGVSTPWHAQVILQVSPEMGCGSLLVLNTWF